MTGYPITLPLLGCLMMLSLVAGQAVMSIDLGSEFLKIAIVKPGVPMEIVLNKESKRKTPAIVAMRDGERLFSDPALTTGVKFPKKAYRLVRDLLGKRFDDPVVERYRKWFPYYDLRKDETTGMPVFFVDEKTQYTPEELMAMIIEHAKHCAEVFAENKMKDVVVTVPAYFNQAERRALVRATNLAGLNLLQLMSDNAAVALNYGIYRRKEFSNVTQHYLFYDMGSFSTTATVVAYQMVKMNVGGMLETNPQLVIKGVGFDSMLGGLEMTLRLRDYLAAEFTKVKKTKSDVYKSDRAMAKLWKEAERLKQILSANTEYMSQVEGLLDDEDFRVRVTRETFEALCEDLFERLMRPVADALKFSQVTVGEISDVLLMGAGTRMPRVQAALQSYLKREELGKSLNTDESAALGAVYQAAHLTIGFKVKKFIVKEAVVYPVLVEFDKHAGTAGHVSKNIKRTLFGHMNPYPQKKVMTFNKHTADFSFNISYGDLSHLAEERQKGFASGNLATISLSGVGAIYDKNIANAESKGVKAHFRMDESGLLHLDGVESVFEKAASEVNDTASTWSKIGDALGGLFGSGKTEEEKDSDKSNKTTSDNEANGTKTMSAEDKPSAESQDKKEQKTEEKGDKTKDDDKTEKLNATKEGNDTKKEALKEKPKPKVIKENVTMSAVILDMVDPDEASNKLSQTKLRELRSRDEEKLALERARNDLEAFIYDLQDRLTQTAYVKCSLEEERTTLAKMAKEADDWQYEQTEDTTKEVFIDKLTAMKKKSEALELRVQEYMNRPKSIEDLRGMIVHGRNFSDTVRNLTRADPNIVTEVEMTTLDKLINNTEAWLNKSIADQEKSPLHEPPIFTKANVLEKGGEIAREIQYLVTKIMSYKRKPPKPSEKNDTSATNSTKKRPKKSANKTAKSTGEDGDAKTGENGRKKTMEDLENIPGIRIIRPEEFLKEMDEKKDEKADEKEDEKKEEKEGKKEEKDEKITDDNKDDNKVDKDDINDKSQAGADDDGEVQNEDDDAKEVADDSATERPTESPTADSATPRTDL